MRRGLLGLLVAAACGRGHHEPIEMSDAMYAQLTSVTPYCDLRRGYGTPRAVQACKTRELVGSRAQTEVWLVTDHGKLVSVTYELEGPEPALALRLRKVLGGVIDDSLLDTIAGAVVAGHESPGWAYGTDVRALVHRTGPGSYRVEVSWWYL